jgi:hypothetical protein
MRTFFISTFPPGELAAFQLHNTMLIFVKICGGMYLKEIKMSKICLAFHVQAGCAKLAKILL